MSKLVICEKPAAAKKIASALGNYKVENVEGIDVFKVKDYMICYASGHLYTLASKDRGYPIFDLLWVPKKTAKVKKILNVIRKLSNITTEFINACDLDQEGEVIAYNILTLTCNNAYNKALRAKFSTLTREDIIKAFSNLEPNVNLKGLAYAGLTRHTLDFLYGINLSRALMDASKKILSIGRVQGPTLAFIIEREIEIRKFTPRPYWVIEVLLSKDDTRFKARYESIIYKRREAEEILNKCKGIDGKVEEVKRNYVELEAPHSFSLSDLQREAYKYLRFSPSYTLSTAEKLYLKALISYPRTSSQKLPPSINYKNIISSLSSMQGYKEIAYILLSKGKLSPNNGDKEDPAHPAIYPTGEKPKSISKAEYSLYDLIVRRFLATFMEPAIVKKVSVTIDISGYKFKIEGSSIVRRSWLEFYGSYKEEHIPSLEEGDLVKNISIYLIEGFTRPPPRYNKSTLLTTMESENIGTKSTRSMIIDILIKRGYVKPNLEPTELGFAVFEVMNRYIPEILSVTLTREMENMLDDIEKNKCSSESVISYASERLNNVLSKFIRNKESISIELRRSHGPGGI